MKLTNDQGRGIFNGVFIGYLVLLLHLLLILCLGVAVVLLKGIYDFRWLILSAGTLLLVASSYLFYRHLKAGNRRFSELMNDPALRDRTLEISLLGGMASVKLGHRAEPGKLIETQSSPVRQLESPTRMQLRELEQLAKMLEDQLITRDEFSRFKKELGRPAADA
jgi:hypothetical protein